MQAGNLELENNGTGKFSVMNNGNFDFSIPDGSTYDIRIVGNYTGQLCRIRSGGSGVASVASPPVDIVCATALTSESAGGPVTTDSETYVPIPNLNSITFKANGTGPTTRALVTLFVPALGGDAAENVYGQGWIGIELDGGVYAQAVNQSAYWGQPGPTTITAVLDVPNGTHEIKAVWKKAVGSSAQILAETDTDEDPSFTPDQRTQLTVTLLNSLAIYDHSAVFAPFGGATTDSTTFSLVPGAKTNVPGSGQVALLNALIPASRNSDSGTNSFELALGGTTIANGSFYHEGSSKAVNLLATRPISAPSDLELNWKVSSGTARIDDPDLRLEAVVFKPGTQMVSSNATGTFSTSSASYVELGNSAKTFSLREARTAFFSLQVDRAFMTGNGRKGLIGVFLDDVSLATAFIQSQNNNLPQVVTIVGLAPVSSGTHTVKAAFRTDGVETLHTGLDTSSLMNLSFIPLE